MAKRITTMTSLTIGIDLGDRRSEVCVLDAAGEVHRRFSVATTRAALQKALSGLAPSRVVLEVGTHSPWVSRLLEALGHEAIVANPRRVRSIPHSDDKCDRVDAEQLARLGRADPRLLHPIRHRGEQAQRDRALLAVRDALVRTRTALVNQARGIGKGLGQRLPRCKAAAFARRMRQEGLEGVFPGMESVVATLGWVNERIRDLEREIEAVSVARYPETTQLRQVSGVGSITALAYVLTLEDPHHFRRSRTVGAYLGLRPRRRQSGDADPLLRITKAGDGLLRRLLVQSAHYVLGPFGPDTNLRRFGLRLAARGGRGAKKKAVIAVARKLAVLLHRLWLTGEVYEPLRGAELSAAA